MRSFSPGKPHPEPPRADWGALLRREIVAGRRVAVLGVGNEERGDDAAGVLCLRRLGGLLKRKERRDLLLLEGGAAPESMTGAIRSFGPDRVLILDAVLGGRKPGAVFPFDPEQIAEEEPTTHRLPLSHLVRYLKESIGCRVTCLGIQPRTLEAGCPVSPSVNLAALRLARSLASLWKRNRSRADLPREEP